MSGRSGVWDKESIYCRVPSWHLVSWERPQLFHVKHHFN